MQNAAAGRNALPSWHGRVAADTLAELFGRDVDPALVERPLKRQVTLRTRWLKEMQELAGQARKARADEARGAAPKAD